MSKYKNIELFQISHENTLLNVNSGDYVAVHPMDFYAGAGIYGLDNGTEVRFSKCIEMMDGKIQTSDGSSTRVMSASDFKKIVRVKLFAKVAIEANVSSIAVASLHDLLMTEKE